MKAIHTNIIIVLVLSVVAYFFNTYIDVEITYRRVPAFSTSQSANNDYTTPNPQPQPIVTSSTDDEDPRHNLNLLSKKSNYVPVDHKLYDNSSKNTCTPVNRFVFVKTAKTAGSTVAGTLHRYGMKHGLVAALPARIRASHIVIDHNTVGVINYSCSDSFPGYNYMVNHIRFYDHKVVSKFIPNAKFITIVRSPYAQLESAFYYLNVDRKLKLQNYSNPFAEFLENISGNYKLVTGQGQNGQLRKLGYDFKKVITTLDVDRKIQELDKDMDLVMVAEYMDESFVLLKRIMCWTFDDIVYHSRNVRSLGKRARQPQTQRMRGIITEWNAGDLRLYKHFNRTLWRKIENYDGDFQEDLRLFRDKNSKTLRKCAGKKTKFCKLLYFSGIYAFQIADTQYARFCEQ